MRALIAGAAAVALLAGGAAARAQGADNNAAVATTTASAATPAHGRNSFSHGEAVRRLRAHGFADVRDLHRDGHGVWRGTASQNGAGTAVWLDYKGNVGTGSE